MTTFIDTIQSLSLKDKRALVITIRAIIAEDVKANKFSKILVKASKEAEKKARVLSQIKAAEEKLAKLTAKLAG